MINNNEMVVVNVHGDYTNIWTFCDAENALQEVKNAQESTARSILLCENNLKNYPSQAGYWENRIAEYKKSKYEVMTFGEFLDRQKKSLLSGGVSETTEENFHENLNVLPPIYWCTIDGVEMFCMSEMYTGTYTNQYARIGNKFYTAMVDITDKTTWIHNRL